VTAPSSTELGKADIDRGAAVLLYLLTWRGRFGNDEAVRSLRQARLDAVIDMTVPDRPCVQREVLRVFGTLAGRSAVWDRAEQVWRERRKGDPG